MKRLRGTDGVSMLRLKGELRRVVSRTVHSESDNASNVCTKVAHYAAIGWLRRDCPMARAERRAQEQRRTSGEEEGAEAEEAERSEAEDRGRAGRAGRQEAHAPALPDRGTSAPPPQRSARPGRAPSCTRWPSKRLTASPPPELKVSTPAHAKHPGGVLIRGARTTPR